MGTPYIPIHIIYIYILLWSVSADKISHRASTKTDLYTNCWKITKIYDNDVYYIYNYVYNYVIYIYHIQLLYIYTHRTWPSPSLDGVKWSEWSQEKVLQIIFEVHVVRPVASVSSNIFKPKIHLENTGRKATVNWQNNPRISSKSSLFFPLRGCAPSIACRVWNSREGPWKITA